MTKSRNALAQDFDNVVSDAQELLKTIGNEADAQVVDAKTRMQASLSVAKDRLVELHDTVVDFYLEFVDGVFFFKHTVG